MKVRFKNLFKYKSYWSVNGVRSVRYKLFTDPTFYIGSFLLIVYVPELLSVVANSIDNILTHGAELNSIFFDILRKGYLFLTFPLLPFVYEKFNLAGRLIAVSNSKRVFVRGMTRRFGVPHGRVYSSGMPGQTLIFIFMKPFKLRMVTSFSYSLMGMSYDLGKVLNAHVRNDF
ncbi:hypothetical protein MMA231_01593 [Asticcacaulis sp. MM231]